MKRISLLGCEKCAELLIAKEVNRNVVNFKNNTALMLAAWKGNS